MKMKTFKILAVVLALAASIFIYSRTTSPAPMPETSKVNSFQPPPIEDDTTDIGQPTGDDPWKEMEKLITAYYEKNGISYSGTVKLIDDNGDKEKIIEEQPFSYSFSNNEYCYSYGKMDVIDKKNFIMIVDHTNKLVALSPKSLNKKEDFFNIRQFKKLMVEQKVTAKVTQLGDEKILTIENIQDPMIQGYRIYYSPINHKITKMLIGMLRLSPLEDENGEINENDKSDNSDNNISNRQADNQGQEKNNADDEPEVNGYYYYVEIIYSTAKPLTMDQQGFNPENKYIRFVNGKVELAKEYQDYELSNSIEQK